MSCDLAVPPGALAYVDAVVWVLFGMPIFLEGASILADKVRSLPFKAGVKERLAELSLRMAGGQLWSMGLMTADSHHHRSDESHTESLNLPEN